MVLPVRCSLDIETFSNVRPFENVMAALAPIQPETERFHERHKIAEPEVSAPDSAFSRSFLLFMPSHEEFARQYFCLSRTP